MKYDKQAALVAQLYKNTTDGRLNWEAAAQSNAFEASFPRFSVILSNRNDDYFIEVINRDGEIIDTFSDLELRQQQNAPYGQSWYHTMKDLYVLARRKARGADAALDDIISSLGGEEPE